MSESDNLPDGGTDTALTALTLDEAANREFHDPEQDTVEAEDDQQSESVTDEADEGQEAEDTTAEDDDQAEDEDEGAEDETAAPEPKDDVTVTVNGQPIALSELKAGYQRQADYTRKTQELGNKNRDLDAMTARVGQTVDAIASYLIQRIPPAPDAALLHSNRDAYYYQQQMHELATKEVNALLSQAGNVTEVQNTLSAEQRRELVTAENAKLVERFPTTASEEGRKKFFDVAANAARDLGYSNEEIGQAMDHRMFALAHYAALGMKAEQATAKAKAKVQNAPPVAPQKARQKDSRHASRRNQEAMKRLARTGSIEDALAIDFD